MVFKLTKTQETEEHAGVSIPDTADEHVFSATEETSDVHPHNNRLLNFLASATEGIAQAIWVIIPPPFVLTESIPAPEIDNDTPALEETRMAMQHSGFKLLAPQPHAAVEPESRDAPLQDGSSALAPAISMATTFTRLHPSRNNRVAQTTPVIPETSAAAPEATPLPESVEAENLFESIISEPPVLRIIDTDPVAASDPGEPSSITNAVAEEPIVAETVAPPIAPEQPPLSEPTPELHTPQPDAAPESKPKLAFLGGSGLLITSGAVTLMRELRAKSTEHSGSLKKVLAGVGLLAAGVVVGTMGINHSSHSR